MGHNSKEKCPKNSTIVIYGHPLHNEADGTTAALAPTHVLETKKTQLTEKTVTVSLKQLSQGSTGAQVKTIQRIIYVRGINSKISIDGDFGPVSKAGVIELQKTVELV